MPTRGTQGGGFCLNWIAWDSMSERLGDLNL